tara:strand:- start:7708 stop:7905 length:198 start_codon:yes stop_codon:yes gene_type:complete
MAELEDEFGNDEEYEEYYQVKAPRRDKKRDKKKKMKVDGEGLRNNQRIIIDKAQKAKQELQDSVE